MATATTVATALEGKGNVKGKEKGKGKGKGKGFVSGGRRSSNWAEFFGTYFRHRPELAGFWIFRD